MDEPERDAEWLPMAPIHQSTVKTNRKRLIERDMLHSLLSCLLYYCCTVPPSVRLRYASQMMIKHAVQMFFKHGACGMTKAITRCQLKHDTGVRAIGRARVYFRSHQREEFGIAINAHSKRVNGAYVGYLISTNVAFSQSTP